MPIANDAINALEERMDGIRSRDHLAGVIEQEASRPPEAEDEEASWAPPPQQQEQSGLDARKAHDAWWQPIVDMRFDDPSQQRPRLHWMNNTRTPLPWPGTWLTAWKNDSPDGVCGVALSGRGKRIDQVWRRLSRDADQIELELPMGSTVERGHFGIGLTKPNSEFKNDDEKREWLKAPSTRSSMFCAHASKQLSSTPISGAAMALLRSKRGNRVSAIKI